jgi:hypothetical protein
LEGEAPSFGLFVINLKKVNVFFLSYILPFR